MFVFLCIICGSRCCRRCCGGDCCAVLCWFFLPDVSSSPPGPYQQDAYVIRAEEKFKHPPFLPPHLLQVLLNKDTGVSVSSRRFTRRVASRTNKQTNKQTNDSNHVSPPVRPHAAAGTQPCDAQPPVRPVNQGDAAPACFYFDMTSCWCWNRRFLSARLKCV